MQDRLVDDLSRPITDTFMRCRFETFFRKSLEQNKSHGWQTFFIIAHFKSMFLHGCISTLSHTGFDTGMDAAGHTIGNFIGLLVSPSAHNRPRS